MSKLYEAAGAFFRSRRGDHFIEYPRKNGCGDVLWNDEY